ncbi:Lrp/AsnC family transcriptional regulator [Rhodococcus rhodochrous]|uniref:Lrp/AsnC family transcriptional regulator n=1 Tax=Rhodococcus rhodochrous TaxID=1829 RepID=A0AA46WZR8_RHORH|nr:Lrp/AsnC family transcriptional regulator [Rhodococcus rhodochrous]UZF46664.1 Lrp/AsnC family transcriptional regulator [Rhodococcus rhodochrous]
MRKMPNPSNGDQTSGENPGDGLDDIDRGILRLLQEDGRMPYRQIARELGVSEGTVRIRSSRMQESGALNVIAIADPFRLGYSVLAFVLIKVEPGAQDRLVEELTALDESTYVSTCIGRADLYMQLVCRDNDHLHELLHRRIPALGGIRDLEAFMELEMHKVSYRYNLS